MRDDFISETLYRSVTRTMSELKTAFEQASIDVQKIAERPDNMTLLRLYALYKQGSLGDNGTDRPGFTDMVGRAKWEAWNALKGTAPEAAMQSYVELVQSLQKA